MTNDEPSATPPRFTIISAVYDVARFLPTFIESIERQTFGGDDVEVIMVDDGSTDDSLAVLEDWGRRRPDLVTVLTKENGGQGSARNLGLDHATGEWITFIDPDDWIIETYLQTVHDFIESDDRVMMVACHRVYYEEAEGRYRDGHPLRRMFRLDQLVNIERRPQFFHGSAPAAFVRRSVVDRLELRFDTRIRPNFEDGHFCTRYLLECDEPLVAFLKTAEYIYRRREDGTSTLQSSVAQAGRYTDVPRLGYLDVLRRAQGADGKVPLWVQYFVLYELSWYFSSEERPNNNMSAARGELGREFVKTLGEISALLDDAAVESFDVRRYKHEWRAVLLHAVRGRTWHTSFAVLDGFDATKRLVRVAYRYVGDPPEARYTLSSRRCEPVATKTRTFRYFGQPLLHEQLAWIPLDGSLRVEVDGQLVELRTSWPGTSTVALSRRQIQSQFAPVREPGIRTRVQQRVSRATARVRAIADALTAPAEQLTAARERIARTVMLRLAASAPARRRFAEAWVLLDRIHDANDSAEHLFRYLRTERPEINAWFTIEQGTDDWDRLDAEGLDHIVPYGSLRWKLLMLNCTDLISSHADIPVMDPTEITAIRQAPWRFSFLQHGVIKDDLSGWLNPKQIDLFVTSTIDEWRSIAGDDNSYVFTPLEVKLTGLPRFDALERARRDTPAGDVDLILVTPTWRHWLNRPLPPGSQRREVVGEFEHTEFAQRWISLLSSDRLRSIAAAHGCTIALLRHPNLSAASLFDEITGIDRLSFSSPDAHRMFARTVVNITDFSSTAFNAAYLQRPSIYYQFDQERVLGGGHVGRAGYFTYETDGFGPVVFEESDVLDNLERVLERHGDPGEPYRTRIDDAFPFRDGRCSERVANEIANLARSSRDVTMPEMVDDRTVVEGIVVDR